MTDALENPITAVKIQMYKMGTGDCFVLKFMQGEQTTFKMLIDCGVWQGKQEHIQPFIEKLKEEIDNHLDALVVTHEHKDHVYGFEAAEELFTQDFKVDRIWMGWPENEDDEKVAAWRQEYGKRRKALALAAEKMNNRLATEDFQAQFAGTRHAKTLLGLRQQFSVVLNDFAELHGVAGEFVGSLKGMAVVKEKLAQSNISYFKPGDVIQNLDGLKGVRIYVLGPPELWEEVKQETGQGEQAYPHNKELEESDLLLQALSVAQNGDASLSATPSIFDETYETTEQAYSSYLEQAWRRIDDDWLFSAGGFALRLNSHINNLSLVLAIEFIDSGKVLLFPGDAEIGSWNSWQKINWSARGFDTTTQKLLNKVVFYKVAHHLSHNGTAKSNGLEMMTQPDLVAMATLDYGVISNGWKSTMPNRLITKDLLGKTKGRVLIMNEENLFYDLEEHIPLSEKIEEYREKMSAKEREHFQNALNDDSEWFMEYLVKL